MVCLDLDVKGKVWTVEKGVVKEVKLDGIDGIFRHVETKDGKSKKKFNFVSRVGIVEKKCRICGNVKPASEFNRHSASKDGLRGECRVCQHKEYRKYWERKKHEGKLDNESLQVVSQVDSNSVVSEESRNSNIDNCLKVVDGVRIYSGLVEEFKKYFDGEWYNPAKLINIFHKSSRGDVIKSKYVKAYIKYISDELHYIYRTRFNDREQLEFMFVDKDKHLDVVLDNEPVVIAPSLELNDNRFKKHLKVLDNDITKRIHSHTGYKLKFHVEPVDEIVDFLNNRLTKNLVVKADVLIDFIKTVLAKYYSNVYSARLYSYIKYVEFLDWVTYNPSKQTYNHTP